MSTRSQWNHTASWVAVQHSFCPSWAERESFRWKTTPRNLKNKIVMWKDEKIWEGTRELWPLQLVVGPKQISPNLPVPRIQQRPSEPPGEEQTGRWTKSDAGKQKKNIGMKELRMSSKNEINTVFWELCPTYTIYLFMWWTGSLLSAINVNKNVSLTFCKAFSIWSQSNTAIQVVYSTQFVFDVMALYLSILLQRKITAALYIFGCNKF